MMLLIAAVAQRWCSGGRFRDSAATVDGIRRTMLMIAGMTDRINSRTSSAFGVRATAAGAESWPAGAGAGATAADRGGPELRDDDLHAGIDDDDQPNERQADQDDHRDPRHGNPPAFKAASPA